MTDESFEAFKNGGGGGEPPDGEHMATLVRAVLTRSRKDESKRLIVLEWQTLDFAYYWTTFRGVAGSQGTYTSKLLSALGVDLSKLTDWDELPDELAMVEGTDYLVKVKRNGEFLNTDVLDKPAEVQTQIPVGPSTTAPAVASAGPASAVFDDDDIPF